MVDIQSEEEVQLPKKKKHKKWKYVVPLLLIIIAIGAYFSMTANSGAKQYEFAKVVKKDIRYTKQVTGNVAAGAKVDLTFSTSGKIETINVKIGDKVKKGDIIASLENRQEELSMKRAKANIAAAQANLNQKLAGSTEQEIKIADVGVTQAEVSAQKALVDLNNAKDELLLTQKKYLSEEKAAALATKDAADKLDATKKNEQNTGSTTEQAIESAKIDLQAQLFSSFNVVQQGLLNANSIIIDDGSSLLGTNYGLFDLKRLNETKNDYYIILKAFEPLYTEFKGKITFTEEEMNAYALQIQDLMRKLVDLDKSISDILSVLPSTSTLTNEQLTTYKNSFISNSSEASQSLSNLILKQKNLIDAKLNLNTSGDSKAYDVIAAQNFYDQKVQDEDQLKINHQIDLSNKNASIASLQAQYDIQNAEILSSKANLDLKQAKPRSVDIAFLKAQVAIASIDLSSAEESYNKTILKAPVSGLITQKNKDAGEDVFAGTGGAANSQAVFEMISDEKYKIDVDIPEVDISKINVGDVAEIKLDALGDGTIIKGKVTRLDPSETVVQDVVFYKAEVVIEDDNPLIRPGMTADVEIILDEKKGVLTLPEKAIQTNSEKYVRILKGKEEVKVPVTVGITNIDGEIEIVSGLKEGDEVILRTLTKK